MSAETKFTRGPWYVIQDDRDGMEWNRHICWDPAGDHRIAFMASDAGTEANAHLIAAAPELYEALSVLRELCGHVRPFQGQVGGTENLKEGLVAVRFMEACDASDAALRKARGEA